MNLKLSKKIWAWFSAQLRSWDPALARTPDERKLEQAVASTAAKFNLQYVEQAPVTGVDADIVIKFGGLSVCGINGVARTGIPQRTLARALEVHIRQLTDVDWEFELASSN